MKPMTLLWNFFSSVKLALFTLGCLAATSIIGTVIPQKESAQFYIKNFGVKTATFFQLFDFTDMYNSWWFMALLGLLSINLIICSIDRLPRVWKLITRDNLDMPFDRLENMGHSETFRTHHSAGKSEEIIAERLSSLGWNYKKTQRDEGSLFFSQKSPWSRLGVYVVHLSILIIFFGAFYGKQTGFKASIMLPELQSSSVVYPFKGRNTIDLGFTVRCDRFDIEFYDNNMPKDYRSKLTVLENDTVVLQKDIEVNDPLHYKGITFYQSSYQPFRDFIFTIDKDGEQPITETGAFQEELQWQAENVRFGIINLESIRDRIARVKIWFTDGSGAPSQFWMKNGEQVEIKRPGGTYSFSAKQRFATGLQVAKDPGVWIVYTGFILLIGGLYMAFFMSHRRIWVGVRTEQDKTAILLAGATNKQAAGFKTSFAKIVQAFDKNL